MTKDNLDLKFGDYKYIRPDFEKLRTDIRTLTQRLVNAKTVEEAIETYNELDELNSNADSMVALAHVKNSIDTKDEFYEVMRRIMVYGPNQIDIPIDYRYITGEFKNRYPELFLDKEAPIELQDLF